MEHAEAVSKSPICAKSSYIHLSIDALLPWFMLATWKNALAWPPQTTKLMSAALREERDQCVFWDLVPGGIGLSSLQCERIQVERRLEKDSRKSFAVRTVFFHSQSESFSLVSYPCSTRRFATSGSQTTSAPDPPTMDWNMKLICSSNIAGSGSRAPRAVTLAEVRPVEYTDHVFLGFESELYVKRSPRAVLLVLRNHAVVVVELVSLPTLIGVAGYAAVG